MDAMYEYTFVRVEKDEDYRQAVREHARDGWRLVQILAPGAGGLWARPDFVEAIFEKSIT